MDSKNLRLFLCLALAAPMASASNTGYSVVDIIFNLSGSSDFNSTYIDHKPMKWHAELENDALPSYTSDHYYTNALRISKYQVASEIFQWNGNRLELIECAYNDVNESGQFLRCKNPPLQADGEINFSNVNWVTTGTTFGHQMYTPALYAHNADGSKIGDQNPFINAGIYDRPFAAWMYVGNFIQIQNRDSFQRHIFTYGVVGDSAFGKDAQEYAHSAPFSGPEEIPGWDTQVGNKLALQYTGVWGINREVLLGIRPYAKIEYGSIIERYSLGAEFEYRPFTDKSCQAPTIISNGLAGSRTKQMSLSDVVHAYDHEKRGTGVFDINFDNCKDNKQKLSFFGFFEYSYVASNYLIEDGITIPEQDHLSAPVMPAALYGTKLQKEARKDVLSLKFGASYEYSDSFTLALSQNFRQKEVVGQNNGYHRWGTVSFDYEIDSLIGFWYIPALIYSLGL